MGCGLDVGVSFRGHVSWLGAGSTSLTRNLLGRATSSSLCGRPDTQIGASEEMTLYTQICDKHKVQVDKNKIAAMTTEMKATKGMVATSKIFNVFFSKAAKEGDPAGVRGQLLPIQSLMRKHALGPEQLEDDVREAYLDALCMK